MRQANQIDIALREEEKRLEREAQLEAEALEAFVSEWGNFYRASWKNRQIGWGFCTLNNSRMGEGVSESRAREYVRMSIGFGRFEEKRPFYFYFVKEVFVDKKPQQDIMAARKWTKHRFNKYRERALANLDAVYSVVTDEEIEEALRYERND